jgi:hypothetical protein
VGEIAAKAVVQLLFSAGKSFTVDGLREKLRESFRQRCRRAIDLPWNPWAARQRHGQIELITQNLENAIALSTSVPRRIPPST